MGKTQVQKNINVFTRRVRVRFHPKKVLLFGSYATGEQTAYSDVDIVVVSEKFHVIPPEKRLDVLYDLTRDLMPDFHVFGYTPEEFERLGPLTSIHDAKEHGIALI